MDGIEKITNQNYIYTFSYLPVRVRVVKKLIRESQMTTFSAYYILYFSILFSQPCHIILILMRIFSAGFLFFLPIFSSFRKPRMDSVNIKPIT